MLKVLALSLLLVSPTIALAQEYQPQPYDPQSGNNSSGTNGSDDGGTVGGTAGDATSTYGIPNADNPDNPALCCGETSTQPGGASGGLGEDANGNQSSDGSP